MFPGQGSQQVGMGRDLAAMYPVAQETFDEADAALGYKLSQLCFEGPEDQLKLTEITQPAILTASVAAWRVLQSKGITPSYVVGHSLGEYSAHVAAGTLSFADAVRTVRNRGKYMQEAVPVGVGAMAAILALAAEKVEEICAEAAQGEVCQAANLNSPDQTVISGNKAAVERAAELAKQRGAKKAVMLPVSAPFHCALMQPAQDRLAEDLRALDFHNPEVPVMCNVDAALVTTGGSKPRCTYPTSDRRGAMGAVDAGADCAGRREFCGSRPREGAQRPDAPDRPLAVLCKRARRRVAAEDDESLQRGVGASGVAAKCPLVIENAILGCRIR